MEKQYHFNPETGKSSECDARKKPCPLRQPDTMHGRSPEEARIKHEAAMAPVLFAPVTTADSEILIADNFDMELLRRGLADGLIQSTRHPKDGDLQVLCYTKHTQRSGAWNPATVSARGLIVRASDSSFEDGVIVERPWRKFFTLEQMDTRDGGSAWSLGDESDGEGMGDFDINSIDFDAPAEVTDKMDGSMGILYSSPDGLPAFATKGSFASEPALFYTKILRSNDAYMEAVDNLRRTHPGSTFIFELVGHDNQIVLTYDKNEPALLGAVDRRSGRYLSLAEIKGPWESSGHRVTDTMPARSLREALAIPPRENAEGVVVRIDSGDQMMVKIKQEDYKALHRLATGIGTKDMRHAIMDDREVTADDLFAVADGGDIENIPSVRNLLAPLREMNAEATTRSANKKAALYDDAIRPIAVDFAEGYRAAMAISDEKIAAPGARKELAAGGKGMNSLVFGVYMDVIGSRIDGRPWSGASKVLRRATDRVKHDPTDLGW